MTAEQKGNQPVLSSPDRSETPSMDELQISPEVFGALTGTVSEPQTVKSLKPWGLTPPLTEEEKAAGGREVDGVSLVQEGAGLWGLTDWRDNKEWSGINQHTWLSTRLALRAASEYMERSPSVQIDLQAMLDGGMVSHAGRRQWDEAGWYPESSPEEFVNERQRGTSNETMGMRTIEGKVSQGAFNLVVALGHNVEGFDVDLSVYDSLEYRIFVYVDHRTTNKVSPLSDRMAGFLNGVFVPAELRNADKMSEITEAFRDIVTRRKAMQRGEEHQMTLEQADEIAEALGASTDSDRLSRRDFMKLLLNDADTEAELEALGIDINSLSEDTVPMPAWEREIREQYVGFARESIFSAIEDFRRTSMHEVVLDQVPGDQTKLAKEFPEGNWWADTARAMYESERDAVMGLLHPRFDSKKGRWVVDRYADRYQGISIQPQIRETYTIEDEEI